MSTESEDYAERLTKLQTVWWKRILPVQAPYRFAIRRAHLGKALDVGCGIGRNLQALEDGSVGVDHNDHSVQQARAIGMTAYTPDGLAAAGLAPKSFDGMLVAHVLEHMTPAEGTALLQEYLPWLRPGARVLIICPQERGYASDATHVTFLEAADIRSICTAAGLTIERDYSFPFPRKLGKAFIYNETHVIAEVPQTASASA